MESVLYFKKELGMRNKVLKRRKKAGKYLQWTMGGISILFVFVCYQNMAVAGKAPAFKQIGAYIQEETILHAWKNCMPVIFQDQESKECCFGEYVIGKLEKVFPVSHYTQKTSEYRTKIESELTYEMAVAAEGAEESKENQMVTISQELPVTPVQAPTQAPAPGVVGKVQEIPREKLNDFDFLIQKFYRVDRTTTIDSSQLNMEELLGRSMKLNVGNDVPQILIYHTHSQEAYCNSVPGDAATSVVGVGEYLTSLLKNQYGFQVIHHMGTYDINDRDHAYSYAEPALKQILSENPSIEVVIDLHRDGVGENTHLVTEVNGKQTAKIMFFNGLSRTTANGNLNNLPNPNLADNLAFSFQMKLAAEEYYPGYTRMNYLKGYRYNMQYCPKSLLIEVGAQTNTVEEAMNAMEPLADLLHKVLTQE